MFQTPGAKVSDDGDTVPSLASPPVTVTVTAAVGRVASFAVKVAVPPASVACPVTALTVSPATSSSSLVADTVWVTTRLYGRLAPPVSPGSTVTRQIWLPSSTSSSLPRTVTVCGEFHRLAAAAEASPPVGTMATVPETPYVAPPSADTSHSEVSWLVTSTFTVWLGLDVRRTVKLSVPPASVVAVEPPLSTTVSPPSSSVTVSVASGGAFTSPLAVAETVTVLSGASAALSTAVTVTVPVLVVEPVAKVSVFALDRLKSLDDAGATAAADTVRVAAALAALSSIAVTVATPPFSEIDDGDSESVALGGATMGNHSVLK